MMGMGKRVNFVILGTDHRFQETNAELEAILRTLAQSRFVEPLGAFGEEYSDRAANPSIARRLAKELQIEWFNIDMALHERVEAGIFEAQRNRPGMFQSHITYRIPSDDVREEAWIKKLIQSASGTTIVVCGYLHFEALAQKLRAKGHVVDQRVFLETVPEIRQA
jgi:hypothetical protein